MMVDLVAVIMVHSIADSMADLFAVMIVYSMMVVMMVKMMIDSKAVMIIESVDSVAY